MERPTVLAFNVDGRLVVDTVPAGTPVRTSPAAGEPIGGRTRVSVTWRSLTWVERVQPAPPASVAPASAQPRKRATSRRMSFDQLPVAAQGAELEMGFHKPKPPAESTPEAPLGDDAWDEPDTGESNA